MRHILKSILFITYALTLTPESKTLCAQTPASTASVATSTPAGSASPAAVASPTPIPLAEIVTQADAVTRNSRDTNANLAASQITAQVEEELPALTREIDARLIENRRIVEPNPSLETLRTLEANWQRISQTLSAWRRDLTTRAAQLDAEIERLTTLGETWRQTFETVRNSETPPEVLQRIEAAVVAIRQAREATEQQRAQTLTLQSRVAAQDGRVIEARAAVRLAREAALNRLFVKDSPAIWSAEVRSRAGLGLVAEGQSSFLTQLTGLGEYAKREQIRFLIHAVIVLILISALYWARRRVRMWAADEPKLKPTAEVFDVPIAAAIVLSVLLIGIIYPQTPRLLQAIFGAVALIPTIIVLRRLVERHLFPILNALVILYFVDLLLTVIAALQVLSRLVFLAEMLGALLFLWWLIKSARLSKVSEAGRDRLWRMTRIAARIAAVGFALAFMANAIGYVSLANLVADAVLGSAYTAVVLYAISRIADGIIVIALRVPPLSLLGMVQAHRSLVRRRLQRVVRWIGGFLWASYSLELLSLRVPFIEKAREILTAELAIGSFSISLGNILAFALTVWATFLLSRFIRFLLNEDIYPRLDLARGVPYAITTTTHYVILLVGFVIAVAVLGFDMTKFTILAGAFGVGLGLGLQNIVSNFVSGLILLFERPIKVGDLVQMGDAAGVVKQIGIRASIINTGKGSDIIVPNGKLIAESVTNWTFSSNRRTIEIRVGAAYGTDPHTIIELLKEVAAADARVAADPPPQALFVEFGADALYFTLQAWTNNSEWIQARSDLAVAINAAFVEHKISNANPNSQRDLHLRSVDPQAVEILTNVGDARRDGDAA
ncbi:MAG: mechanosensitive ion channel [Pyrinomonadaceae bacterium MAG19_C2-C3]|nr:mechanosensitive ion channel [Pyrinomonadaceae bacterium MAG19_C2-C3]